MARRRTSGFTTVAVLSVALVAVFGLAPSSAVATFPGENGLIAYYDGDLGVIRTIQPDGTSEQSITEGHGPAWSPNGRRIAFARAVDWDPTNAHIFTIRPDGSDRHHVTWGKGPSFSPSGGRIVFTRDRYRRPPPTIYTAWVKDGSHQRRLVRGVNPTWSPDGDLIAFARDRRPERGWRNGIWTMHPDGTHQRRLTNAPYESDGSSGLDFSPNGRWIVFSRDDQLDDEWAMRVRSNRPGEVERVPCVYGNPSYSPDGKGFVSRSKPGRWGGSYQVFVTHPGCPARRLTPSGEYNTSPAWQPLPDG